MTDKKINNEPNIQSVSRAIQILRCFEEKAQMNLTEISKAVGLHKSTTFGIVTTLKNADFLTKDEFTGNYRLGMALFHLASCFEVDIRKISTPYIHELCNITGETVNLVIPDDNQVVYIDKCESKHSIRISTSIGTRLPMYCTAVGKVILSCYNDDDMVSSLLDRTQLVQNTSNTLIHKDDILKELKLIRSRGYAIDNEEFDQGLICIAAPICNAIGVPVAAISCSGPLQRMDTVSINRISKEVVRISRIISKQM